MARKFALVLVAFLLVCIVSPVSAKSYSAERYDVTMTVLPGGDMLVRETIVFNFQGGPFTYVFRHLALTRTDGIDQIAVSMDGVPLPEGKGSGQVEIEGGDPIRVTWHFEPVSDSSHTFEITYRVKGVIRAGESDTLIWIAIPQEHEYFIENSLIELYFPDQTSLVNPPILEGADAQGEAVQGGYRFEVKGIPADKPLTITATFPSGSLIQSPPKWQEYDLRMAAETKAATPIGVAAGVLTIGIFGGILFSFLTRNRRENFIPPDTGMRLVSPPSKASPLMAVKLIGGVSPVMALLFDLAERGVLTIEEGKGVFGVKTFTLRRMPTSEPLLPIEEAFLHALFTSKKGVRDGLPLSEVSTKIAGSGKTFTKALDEAMVTAGWIDPDRKKKRDRLVIFSVIATVLGGFCFAGGFVVANVGTGAGNWGVIPISAVMIGVGAGTFIGSLITLIGAAAFSPLTIQGVYEQTRWKGFQRYLKDITRGKEAITTPEIFERYLPYVAGLGIGAAWAKIFSKTGQVQVPAWFRALNQAHGGDDFGSFVALMSASDSAGTSGDGGAAAAGASGGGASGAG